MFNNLRLHIFIYYLSTVTTFLVILYYFIEILEVESIYILSIVLFCFIVLSAIFISKLAIDPLQEHIVNLQSLSKETLHELNLPISTIKSNSSMLKKSNDDEKSLKRLLRIERACEMLSDRYNELDYMIKSQTQVELKEYIDLDILLKQRIDFLKEIYPTFDFKLNLSPTKIYSDKIGLSKVIDNLIDNAVKYSLDLKRIDISLEDTTLEIKDYGCGIAEVELVKIFDSYYQSNSSTKGFGIGLSMVKRFCDTNSIDLHFLSSVDSGTSVILKFKDRR